MWLLLLALLLGVAHAEQHNHAWQVNNEYHYIVESRSFTGLPEVSNQYSGVLLRAILKIQSKDETTLFAKLSKVEFAPIHTKLPNDWDSKIPDGIQSFQPLITSDKPFEIKMEHGLIKELIFEKDVPTWEVNINKGVVSQLQVDTQGENMIPSRHNQVPDVDHNNAMYKSMEDSIGGICEVLYDINAIPEALAQRSHHNLPGAQYKTNGKFYEIMKTNDYENCWHRPAVHYGIPGGFDFEPGSHADGAFLSKSSITEVKITGNLKSFTLHSSMTTEKVVLSPTIHGRKKGIVASRVNVSLSKMHPISKPWQLLENGESVGDLVYTYDQPFSPEGDDRTPGSASISYSYKNQNVYSGSHNEESPHHQHYDDSSASNSDESGSSEVNDYKKNSRLQLKPTLNDAPQYPFLPYFIANQGKALSTSDEVGLVNRAKTLASEIGREVQNPNTIPQEQTLEKFSMLVDILRTMDTKQMKEVQNDLYQPAKDSDPTDDGQKVRSSTWVAFRDAVICVGSGPALMLITDLIKERKLNSAEMISVFSALPKTAKEPTPEYVNAFYKLATTEVLLNDKLASSAAILAFTELVRYSQVNRKASHNRYPIHIFGNFAPKKNDALYKDYFPYLIENMEQGIEANDYRATIYIRALGNTGHPKIISVFEPYLEGKKPSTVFQRLMMVTSLDKLCAQHPKALQGLTYRIYLNAGESYKVRVPAVFLLMRTNPPLSMLQRMARNTNYQVSKQVNSAVKTLIESASELKGEEYQEFARNARTARAYLTSETHGLQYAVGFYSEDNYKNLNIKGLNVYGWLGSDDSIIPEAIYTSSHLSYGDVKAPRIEHGDAVSSIKELFKMLKDLMEKIFGHKQYSPKNSKSQEIASMLAMEANRRDKFNSFFISRDQYRNMYYAIDEDMIHSISQLLKLQDAAEVLKSGKNFDIMHIQNYQLITGFPTATGLPFVYDLQTPHMIKVTGNVQIISNPDYAAGDTGVLQNIDASVDMRMVYTRKVQARYGFVTPFEGQQYIAGVDHNIQFQLPISAKVNYDGDENSIRLKLEPMNKDDENNLYHYSMIPFTCRHNVNDLKPLTSENYPSKLNMMQTPEEKTYTFGKKTQGMAFKVREVKKKSSPSIYEKRWDMENIKENLMHPILRPDIDYYVLELMNVPNPLNEQSVVLTVQWDQASKNEPTGQEQSPNSVHWPSEPDFKEPSDKDPGSPIRRRELMKETLKDLPTGDAYVVDVSVEIPGQEPRGHIATVAFAKNKVGGKFKTVFYYKQNDVTSPDFDIEMCGTLQASHPLLSVFGLKDIKREGLQRYVDAKVVAGKTCSRGHAVEMHGRHWQSEEYRNTIENQRMRSPSAGSRTLMDRIRFIAHTSSTGYGNKWEKLPQGYMRSHKSQQGIKHGSDESDDDDSDTMVVDFAIDPGTQQASMVFRAPGYQPYEQTTKLESWMLKSFEAPDPLQTDSESIDGKQSSRRPASNVCILDQDIVHTFDGLSYPLEMNDCWYIALTPSPEQKSASSKPFIPDDKQASVTIHKDASNPELREMALAFGANEIKVTMLGPDFQIKYNNNPLQLNQQTKIVDEGNENEFEVIKLPYNAVRVQSKKYGLKATYDGGRMHIELDAKYRKSVRGLCGNFDGEVYNDFLTPQNRLTSNPEDFSAFYTLPVGQCRSVAQHLKHSEKSLPMDSPKLQNVVSDRDAGRFTHSNKNNWGYPSSSPKHPKNTHTIVRTKMVPNNDQTCFSLRPLPTCAPGTQPDRTRTVLFPVYCLPSGDSAKRLTDRINKGANPDLSQKKVSMKLKLEIPEKCSPAA